MEIEFVTKEKDVVELEFVDKDVPVALAAVLSEMGVDAYTYDPHPLTPGFRLHVESKDALADLKKAVKGLDKQWSEFTKDIVAKLK